MDAEYTPLGLAEIDAAHEAFSLHLAVLRGAAPAQQRGALEAFAVHCRAHFDTEAQLMADSGFPGPDCHLDEHAAVLRSLDEVLSLHDLAPVLPRLAAALGDWFPAHVDHLDSALAAWVVKRRTGGVPLVLRRAVR
jgi:hemerythrin